MCRELDKLKFDFGIKCVIEGGASGADAAASQWGRLHGIPIQTFPAKWRVHGKSAGPIRNKQMLEEGKPTIVLAFPGGSGTGHMVSLARKAGVPVVEIPLPKPYSRKGMQLDLPF